MSVTSTIDVWCDHPHCYRWEHGVVVDARHPAGGIADARRAVTAKGWTRRSVRTPPHGIRRVLDLCPNHATYPPTQIVADLQAALDKRT